MHMIFFFQLGISALNIEGQFLADVYKGWFVSLCWHPHLMARAVNSYKNLLETKHQNIASF